LLPFIRNGKYTYALNIEGVVVDDRTKMGVGQCFNTRVAMKFHKAAVVNVMKSIKMINNLLRSRGVNGIYFVNLSA
jgi:hypothetical protein